MLEKLSTIQTSDETVTAADGTKLAARFFQSSGEAEAPSEAKGSVLIVPAMGVSQGYYEPFATWLAEQGFHAATFDYRGVGRSRTGGLRGFRADLFDWARLDCAAMVEALSARAPGEPFFWIGHSLGGQILPFVPNRERIAKVVTIAAGSGYWLENATPLRRRAWWLWFFVVPLALPLFGYFPGKRLRKVGDLPKGVMEQWRRWCLNREYAVGAEGEGVRQEYAAVRTPIVSLSFADDELMSARNTESLHGFYRNAPRTMKRLSPQDIGEPQIGHFGFFRSRFKESLWRQHLLPELG
jgi:predicted alpha/beta hydrolase